MPLNLEVNEQEVKTLNMMCEEVLSDELASSFMKKVCSDLIAKIEKAYEEEY